MNLYLMVEIYLLQGVKKTAASGGQLSSGVYNHFSGDKIHAFIERLDNLLFTLPSRKDNEWGDIPRCFDQLEEGNPVYPWHLVVGDDGEITLGVELFQCLASGSERIDRKRSLS